VVLILLLLEALLLSKTFAICAEVLRVLFFVLIGAHPIICAVFVEEVVSVLR
jgi:hypothetical protein